MINNKKTIGILGGMGPLASAHLYYRIVKIAQSNYNAQQDTDFPPMLIYNLPLDGFNEFGFADLNLVKKQLIAGVKKLEDAGSDFIIIACNTVHHFYSEMQKAINIPILSIIDETIKKVKSNKHNTVAVLSSEDTNKLMLYQKAFKKNNIKVININLDQQKIINNVILKVMSGSHGEKELDDLKAIIFDLIKSGAEAIVVGCTELPLVINADCNLGIVIYDTVDIIAESALNKAFLNNK